MNASGAGAAAVRVVHHGHDALGEGPHWSVRERCLYRVDILGRAVHRLDADGAEPRTVALPEPVGAVVPRRAGGLLVAMASGVHALDADGGLELLVDPEPDRPGNRLNDGKCDARGRFWIGSLAADGAPGAGALWRIGTDGRAARALDGVDIANGLGWSPDGTRLYFTDSGRRTIDVHAFDPASGELGERSAFARLPEGVAPDGLAVDAEGCVWSAIWDGARLVRFDPDGAVERTVAMPVPRPTSCAFGGDDGRTLFVTSARAGLDRDALAAAPLSGAVFALDAPAPGLPETSFGMPVEGARA